MPVSCGVYSRGYIACATNSNQEKVVEFVSTQFGDPFLKMIKSGGVTNGAETLEKISSLLNVSTPYFDCIKTLKAEFDIYTYV